MTCFRTGLSWAVFSACVVSAASGCGGGDTANSPPGVLTGGSGGMAGSDGGGDALAGKGGGDAAPDAKGGSGGTEAGPDVLQPEGGDTGGAGGEASTGCKNDAQCAGNPAGPYCNTQLGICIECKPTDPTTCKTGTYCDSTTFKCVPGCDGPDDCNATNDGGAMSCDTTTHKCVGCLNDDQCPLGQICKLGTCEAGCTLQHGCQSGYSCCSGKCADISTDMNNCGACSKPCAFPNAVVTCTGGACVLDSCQPGFENCDKNASNGCETPVTDGGIGCACQPGEVQDCYTGPPNTKDIGPCKGGKATCNSSGSGWSNCVGEVVPTTESCYTPIDDNCNGEINEGGTGCGCTPNTTEACYTGPTATRNVGACKDGTWTCNSSGTAWGTCEGQVLPTPETCLTPVDDNCNGEVNESGGSGCQCTPNSTHACYGGPPGTENVGVCKAGTQVCDAMGLGYGPCTGDVVPSPDICSDNLDNDCNNVINDGIGAGASGCVCFPLATVDCYNGPTGTINIGVCKGGSAVCNADGTALGTCVGEVVPSIDHCTDSLDNDCNAVLNDGFGKGGNSCVCVPASQQDCYTGPTGTLGVGTCQGGKATCLDNGTAWGACLGQIIPDLDSCLDSLDNDCNGILNDGNHLAPGCACIPGSIKCEGNNRRLCDSNGDWGAPVSCGSQICSNTLGCVNCLPGTATCNGATAHKCKEDGSGYVDYYCDPVMGSSCANGACTGACAPDAMTKSYIGCDYFATVTANDQLETDPYWGYFMGNFAVAVSNTTSNTATITITQGATTITTQNVGANSVAVITLPWNDLRTTVTTARFNGLAYRIRTTQPVTVYQFNPLQYTDGSGSYTYTNDASLLLPVSAWNVRYMVASRNTWVCNGCNGHPINANIPGFYAVVASQNATVVTLTRSPTTQLRGTVTGLGANGSGTVTLNAGDVLQVMSGTDAAHDLTGTQVTSDKPVEVIGGHDCTFVPWNLGWCDHLEESMFPVSTLSTEYIVSAPSVPAQSAPAYSFTRVIATEASTTLTYDPPHGGWPGTIAQAGAYIELDDNAAFRVTADKKVLVSQYMKGNGDSTAPADPAMALAITTPQFRNDYLFHAPTNYDNNYVNVIAPTGSSVLLDSVAISSWTAIGGTGYSVARVALPNGANGNHRINSSVGFGITVYGYGYDTSYWYPGGLNLSDL